MNHKFDFSNFKRQQINLQLTLYVTEQNYEVKQNM